MAETDNGAGAPPPPPPNSAPKSAELTEKGSVASGKGTDALGDQIAPETMLNEADGNRTLMKPVTDPGPVPFPGGVNIPRPDRSKGQHRVSDVADPVSVTMRTSTGHSQGFARHSGDITGDVELPPDVFASGAASDIYNKEGGKGLTDQAMKNAGEPKEVAPQSP